MSLNSEASAISLDQRAGDVNPVVDPLGRQLEFEETLWRRRSPNGVDLRLVNLNYREIV